MGLRQPIEVGGGVDVETHAKRSGGQAQDALVLRQGATKPSVACGRAMTGPEAPAQGHRVTVAASQGGKDCDRAAQHSQEERRAEVRWDRGHVAQEHKERSPVRRQTRHTIGKRAAHPIGPMC